ncbi:MAG: ABC transporter substrate-binding protein [Treponema sp.]|jgi:peptide/nickel transport system substrate-binding protein|nr:ABC transporter substrate-binding protein [Treponema sp.]
MNLAKKIGLVMLILVMSAGIVFARGQGGTGSAGGGASASSATAAPGSLPRKETLYFNGILWDQVGQWNPYFTGSTSSFGITVNAGLSRQLIYETLFIYDLLTGTLKPQLADSYAWNGQTLTIQLNRNVKFWDGKSMTASDVVNSYQLQKTYATGASAWWAYIDSVSAQGDYTVVIKGNPSRFNPKQIETSIGGLYITQKAEMDKVVAGIGNGSTALGQWTNYNPDGTIATQTGTGPYKPYISDETKAVLQRVDTYWGQHSSRYGKLPPPRYIVHAIYKDNATGDAAFRAAEVDISQQFISSVWTMFNANISTFIPQAPYYFPGVIPMIIYNTKDPRLADPAVRKAIAMALDYDTIGKNAMSGYTAPYVASLMLPTPAEQALIDANALKPYQWSGNLQEAVAAANKLLDDAGWVKGADGIRAKGGVKLSGIRAECPQGWSDWNASLEVVAQAGKQIGIDIQTYFPIATVWTQDLQNGTFDIIMNSPGGVGIASPWSRAYAALSSSELPPEGTPNTIGDWGRWINKEATDIIGQIAGETDAAKLKQLWTRLNIIYLQEIPVAGLMYRPGVFHTVNETVWTGYPKMNDGSGVPPTLCIDGYGIKGLYNLKNK